MTQRNQRKSGSRSRRAKVIRDPNAPKKPNTAYILYFQERKPYYVSTNPSKSIKILNFHNDINFPLK